MNSLALKEGTTDESAADFADYLESKINCEFISYIDSYIIEAGYFYDTNFHLNEAGVLLRTKTLIEDIMLAEGRFTSVNIKVPEAPALPDVDVKFLGDDENAGYFTYDTLANGALVITGLTGLGKTMNALTIPLGSYNVKVTAIGKGAFSQGVCKTVTVTDDTNLRNFLDGSFDNCSVSDLYIYYNFTDEEEKLAPASNFSGITIHVPEGSQYVTHYDWNDTSGGYKLVIIK
jgi:hypothetical protein